RFGGGGFTGQYHMTIQTSAPGVIAPYSELTGRLDGADADEFRFNVAEPGRLTASVGAEPDSFVNPRLELFDSDGRLLLRSDDRGPGEAGPRTALHLRPGASPLRVSRPAPPPRPGSDESRLSTRFEPATPPRERPLVSRISNLRVAALGDFT